MDLFFQMKGVDQERRVSVLQWILKEMKTTLFVVLYLYKLELSAAKNDFFIRSCCSVIIGLECMPDRENGNYVKFHYLCDTMPWEQGNWNDSFRILEEFSPRVKNNMIPIVWMK